MFEAPERQLANLSARLKTEVIWLGLQSTVDALIFHHWKDRKRLRSLVHGCKDEGVWERVEGKAQSWERDVFLDPKDLKVPLQSVSTNCGSSGRKHNSRRGPPGRMSIQRLALTRSRESMACRIMDGEFLHSRRDLLVTTLPTRWQNHSTNGIIFRSNRR